MGLQKQCFLNCCEVSSIAASTSDASDNKGPTVISFENKFIWWAVDKISSILRLTEKASSEAGDRIQSPKRRALN
jgi:hypothetical protein